MRSRQSNRRILPQSFDNSRYEFPDITGDELDTPSSTAPAGSSNPPLAPALILDFHRADLRAYHGSGGFDGLYRLVLGYDHTDSSGTNVETWVAEPSLRWHYRTGERLTLVWGRGRQLP